jgi:hypothetical protein
MQKAEAWFRSAQTNNVLDAASIVLGLAEARDSASLKKCDQCLDFIRKAEAEHAGWGPYPNARTEPFDTAVELLSLIAVQKRTDVKKMIEHGRAYLVTTQEHDGSWPETTRPPGGQSYAQRISTTAWATMALLACQRGEPPW